MSQYLVGHRGAAGLAPENTLKAYKIGCENGADVVECDIHLSKDKEIVVIHDNTLDRTTNGKDWVRDLNLQQLKLLNAGENETIPTLQEVLDLVTGYNKKLIIEIKGESWPIVEETTSKLSEFITEKQIEDKIIVHSFWHHAVKKLKEVQPNVLTAIILMVGLPANQLFQMAREAKADGVAMAYDYITEKFLSLIKKNNLFLDAWLLNDEVVFQKMKKMGVNGLITNYPGKFHL